MNIDIAKMREWSEQIQQAAGMLLLNENGPGNCDTQAIRMLLNVADELIELPQLERASAGGCEISV